MMGSYHVDLIGGHRVQRLQLGCIVPNNATYVIAREVLHLCCLSSRNQFNCYKSMANYAAVLANVACYVLMLNEISGIRHSCCVVVQGLMLDSCVLSLSSSLAFNC